jgi:hypothetical protein
MLIITNAASPVKTALRGEGEVIKCARIEPLKVAKTNSKTLT